MPTAESDLAGILVASPLLGVLSAALQTHLALAAHLRILDSRQFLFRQGDAANAVLVVGQGRFRLLQHTRDGADVSLDLFTAGDVIGLTAVLREGEFAASCQSITSGVVAVVPADVFRRVLAQSPDLMRHLLKLMATRIATQHDHIRELSSAHAEERLASALMRLAGKVGVEEAGAVKLDVPATRQMLAEMCGLTLHSVSRILSQWHRARLVYAGRESVVLLKVEEIRAFCLS